jgi:hypothetical protein
MTIAAFTVSPNPIPVPSDANEPAGLPRRRIQANSQTNVYRADSARFDVSKMKSQGEQVASVCGIVVGAAVTLWTAALLCKPQPDHMRNKGE